MPWEGGRLGGSEEGEWHCTCSPLFQLRHTRARFKRVPTVMASTAGWRVMVPGASHRSPLRFLSFFFSLFIFLFYFLFLLPSSFPANIVQATLYALSPLREPHCFDPDWMVVSHRNDSPLLHPPIPPQKKEKSPALLSVLAQVRLPFKFSFQLWNNLTLSATGPYWG